MNEIAKQEQAPAPEPASESSSLISMIERAARDPNVDIDKMERLFQMHERVEARRSEAAYNAAMSEAQADLIPVVRNQTNKHTNSKYADLAAIADAAMPIIHKHGFGLSFSEAASDIPNHLGISCEVTHSAGYSKRYFYNIPLDAAGSQGKVNKTQTQAYGSTFTYGRRYATCGVFNIAIKDKDGNSTETKLITDEQAEELSKLISAASADIDAVLAFHKIESLGDMPARDFAKSRSVLLARKAKLEKEKQHATG